MLQLPGGLAAPGTTESDRPRDLLSCSSDFVGMKKSVNCTVLIYRWEFKISVTSGVMKTS